MRSKIPILTPAAKADIQSPNGTNVRITARIIMAAITIPRTKNTPGGTVLANKGSVVCSIYLSLLIIILLITA
jgi:hypothetical protein